MFDRVFSKHCALGQMMMISQIFLVDLCGFLDLLHDTDLDVGSILPMDFIRACSSMLFHCCSSFRPPLRAGEGILIGASLSVDDKSAKDEWRLCCRLARLVQVTKKADHKKTSYRIIQKPPTDSLLLLSPRVQTTAHPYYQNP